MSVKELMVQYGFIFNRTCYCDGFATEVYLKGLYEIRWRKYKYRVRIKKNGITVNGWMGVDKLSTTMHELFGETIPT